jgi:RNA polymerase sigma-70 factor (ECF subfamily)
MLSEGPSACRGSRLIPLAGANGLPAFGQYKPTDEPGVFSPWSITVLEFDGPAISGLNFFLDTDRLFPLFGLPPELRD